MEFVQGSGDSSPTFQEGHCAIFNIHQLMPADGTPSLTSIRGMAHNGESPAYDSLYLGRDSNPGSTASRQVLVPLGLGHPANRHNTQHYSPKTVQPLTVPYKTQILSYILKAANLVCAKMGRGQGR